MAEISLRTKPDGSVGVATSPYKTEDAKLSEQQPDVPDAFQTIPLEKSPAEEVEATAPAEPPKAEAAVDVPDTAPRDAAPPKPTAAVTTLALQDIEAGSSFEVKPEGTKFLSVIGSAGQELYDLGSVGASNGMLSLALGAKETAKSSLVDFKEHSLDLCVTMITPSEPGDSKLASLGRQVQPRKLLQLPYGTICAIGAVISFICFCLVHYPAKFLPIATARCSEKLVEWQVQEKMTIALMLARQYAGMGLDLARQKALLAFNAAAASPAAAKLSEMSRSSAAVAASQKISELRISAAERLVKLRGRKDETILPVTQPAS